MIKDYKLTSNIHTDCSICVSYAEEDFGFHIQSVYEEHITKSIEREIMSHIEKYFSKNSTIIYVNLIDNPNNIFEIFNDNYTNRNIIMNYQSFVNLGYMGSSLEGRYNYNIDNDLYNNDHVYVYDDMYMNIDDDNGIFEPITQKINRRVSIGFKISNPITYILVNELNINKYISFLRDYTIQRILE